MANDVIAASGPHPAGANGPPAAESVVERATRILRGDIRPGDYLTLPPEAAAKVEWEFEMAQQLRPGAVLTETEKHRIRQTRALEYHFGGRWVITLRTADGVIALGSGEDAISRLSREIAEEFQPRMRCEFPYPPDCL